MDKIDFEKLKLEIESATKKAFTEMVENHNDENVYAFALYSDEGAMTMCPSTNTLEHLEKADPNDIEYHKFEPFEWKYEMIGADDEFSKISKSLYNEIELNEYKENEEYNEEWFNDFQNKLYSTGIEVLKKLKDEGFFKKVAGKDIFLIFAVSEYEFEQNKLREIITMLNDNEYREEYLAWMDTWGQA